MAFLQDTKPDIMTLNETFLRTPDKVFFPGYQPMARADRPNRHGGGVAILVRTGVNFDVVNPIPTSEATSNEQLTITIQTTTGHYTFQHCTARFELDATAENTLAKIHGLLLFLTH